MVTNERKVVKTIAEEIVKAINTLVDDNNKRFVNNQIKNYIASESYSGSSSGGGVMPGTINASQVNGLYNTVAGYIINAAAASSQGDPIAGRIISTLTGIADVELQSAKIRSAQVEDLSASVGNFIHLIANHATIQDVDTEAVFADIADIGMANIGQATINWGQIDYLTGDTAIFHEIVGGRLIIDNLVVSEMITKDTNGNMVRIIVDSQGAVVTQTVTFDGDDILNSASTNGSVLIDNTVNGSKLVAESVTAGKINVGSLFANEADVGSISTYIINSKRIGDGLDISGNSSIQLTNSRLALILDGTSSSSQLVLTEGMIEAISDIVAIEAAKIDLTAYDEFNTLVGRVSDAEGSITTINQTTSSIEARATNLETSVSSLQVDVNGISSTVYDSETGASIVSQNADKINWLIGTNEDTSEMELTSEGLTAIAENIDLTANDTIRLQGEQIQVIASEAGSAKDYTDQLDEIYTFESDGLRTRMTDGNGVASKWSTLVAEDGFYIDHDDIPNKHVGAFHEETFEVRSIKIGKIIARGTSGGGWAWNVIE